VIDSSLLTMAAALLVGLLLGVLLTRRLSSPIKQRKQLGEELRRAQEKQAVYEREVAEHFVTTSELVNQMTDSYRNLHQHLATSAETLTDPSLNPDLLTPAVSQLELDIGQLPALDTDSAGPPKDYAPSQGVLNENYGLSEPTARDERVTETSKPQLSVVSDTAEALDDDPTLKVG